MIDDEFDLDLTGFSLAEIDLALDDAREARPDTRDAPEDAVPAPSDVVVTQRTDGIGHSLAQRMVIDESVTPTGARPLPAAP